jgi:hypothetical protein
MKKRFFGSFNRLAVGEMKQERAPEHGILRGLGRMGVSTMTDERVKRTPANEMVVTQGAKLRPVEDFVGVVESAQVKRAAIQRLREQRRNASARH